MPKQCSPRRGEPGLQPGHHFFHTGCPLPSLQPQGGKGKMVPWALPCECPLVQGQTSPQAALKLAIRDSWSSHSWVSLGVCLEISGHGGTCLQLSLSRQEVPSAARQWGWGGHWDWPPTPLPGAGSLLSTSFAPRCFCPALEEEQKFPRHGGAGASLHATGTRAVLGEAKFPVAGVRVALGPSQKTEMQKADFSHM